MLAERAMKKAEKRELNKFKPKKLATAKYVFLLDFAIMSV